jgi:hypothetical protein
LALFFGSVRQFESDKGTFVCWGLCRRVNKSKS